MSLVATDAKWTKPHRVASRGRQPQWKGRTSRLRRKQRATARTTSQATNASFRISDRETYCRRSDAFTTKTAFKKQHNRSRPRNDFGCACFFVRQRRIADLRTDRRRVLRQEVARASRRVVRIGDRAGRRARVEGVLRIPRPEPIEQTASARSAAVATARAATLAGHLTTTSGTGNAAATTSVGVAALARLGTIGTVAARTVDQVSAMGRHETGNAVTATQPDCDGGHRQKRKHGLHRSNSFYAGCEVSGSTGSIRSRVLGRAGSGSVLRGQPNQVPENHIGPEKRQSPENRQD